LATASFNSIDRLELGKTFEELMKLPAFANVNHDKHNHMEEFYLAYMNEAKGFLKSNEHLARTKLEFSMLIKNMEQVDDMLELEIKPFKRYNLLSNKLYAVTDQETTFIAGPSYTYCNKLSLSDFVIRDEQGKDVYLKTLNQYNLRP